MMLSRSELSDLERSSWRMDKPTRKSRLETPRDARSCRQAVQMSRVWPWKHARHGLDVAFVAVQEPLKRGKSLLPM